MLNLGQKVSYYGQKTGILESGSLLKPRIKDTIYLRFGGVFLEYVSIHISTSTIYIYIDFSVLVAIKGLLRKIPNFLCY